jgi:hypothetical protein
MPMTRRLVSAAAGSDRGSSAGFAGAIGFPGEGSEGTVEAPAEKNSAPAAL